MDRFIDTHQAYKSYKISHLKSNMDRFIDETRYITATPEDI